MATKRRPRSDGLANRERIVKAARQIYAELGPDAPFDAIATRAGVANGTLYRHFPNSETLRTAIYAQRLEETRFLLDGLEAERDPGVAVERYFEWIAAEPDVSLIDIVFDPGPDPVLVARRRALRAQTERLFARARDAGALQPDLTLDDVEVVIFALTQVGVAGRIPPVRRERFTRLIIDGLRGPQTAGDAGAEPRGRVSAP